MSLASNLTAGFQRVATEFRTIRSLSFGGPTAGLAGLTTTDKSSLVAAINEARAAVGATNLDALTDVTITAPATGQVLRYNGGTGQWENVDGTTYFQPRSANLDTLAAQASTAYGRSLLNLADATALTTQVQPGSTAAAGKLQLTTVAEGQTGTDATKATTAAAVKAAIDQRIVNDPTLASGSTTNAPSIAAVKAYADSVVGAQDAMVFKGVIDASANPNYPAANRGDTYRISVAGKIGGAAGVNVEVGDLLIALTDGTAAGTQAAVGAQWNISQANIDGAVTGPAAAGAGNLPLFSGTSGKVLSDSGRTVSDAVANNTNLVSGSAVVGYAQPVDAELTALAALVSAGDRLPYFTGSGSAALATFTTYARTLVAAVDAATARGILSTYSQVEIGDPNTDFVTAFNTAVSA